MSSSTQDGGTAIDPSCKASTHGLYWSADTAFLNHTTSASHGGKSLLKAFFLLLLVCYVFILYWGESEYDSLITE